MSIVQSKPYSALNQLKPTDQDDICQSNSSFSLTLKSSSLPQRWRYSCKFKSHSLLNCKQTMNIESVNDPFSYPE
jgi:hypothetical protein